MKVYLIRIPNDLGAYLLKNAPSRLLTHGSAFHAHKIVVEIPIVYRVLVLLVTTVFQEAATKLLLVPKLQIGNAQLVARVPQGRTKQSTALRLKIGRAQNAYLVLQIFFKPFLVQMFPTQCANHALPVL